MRAVTTDNVTCYICGERSRTSLSTAGAVGAEPAERCLIQVSVCGSVGNHVFKSRQLLIDAVTTLVYREYGIPALDCDQSELVEHCRTWHRSLNKKLCSLTFMYTRGQ